jgi:pilus assembly protein Flp/PilA
MLLGRLLTLFPSYIKRFFIEDNGPTVVEYGVLLSLIIVVCITIIITLGGQLVGMFTNSSTEIAVVPGS